MSFRKAFLILGLIVLAIAGWIFIHRTLLEYFAEQATVMPQEQLD